ncbi:hypothetical protein V8E52_006779, partial [Russula decolorans]
MFISSSRTTSIYILDDDSLLNTFYLYRLAVTVTDEDENFDDMAKSSFLGLCLVCSPGTPVADMLAHSPPLPLIIDYLEDRNMTTEDEEGFSSLSSNLIASAKFVMAINDELPILEYLVATGWEDDATLIFTGTIQAPHLGLVTLCLYMDDSSTYLKSKLPAPVDFIPASTRDA